MPAEGQGEQRPAWLPEKFASGEALATAYAELERKQSGTTTPPATPATPTIPPTPEAQAQKNGVDLKAVSDEYTRTGKLTDTTYQDLEKKGFSRSQVDDYISGQQARATQIVNSLNQVVGGEAQRKALYSWAQAELTPADLNAFNAVMDTGKAEQMTLALQGLFSRYQSATGREAILIAGEGTPATTGAQPFTSQAEIVKAMSDERYKNGDKAYIQGVQDRMAVTNGLIRTLDNGRKR